MGASGKTPAFDTEDGRRVGETTPVRIGIHRAVHRGRPAKITRDGDPAPVQRRRDPVERLAAPRDQRDGGARTGESARGRLADAT